MSELTSRTSYLKGLADGMKLNTETNEGKLINSIIDVLNDIAEEIEMMDSEQSFLADKIDELEDAVEIIGEDTFGENAFDEDDDYDDGDTFQINCEECGEKIILTGEDLDEGEIICPNCGEKIELEFTCSDDDCDCGCHE